MKIKKFICISCPIGCILEATIDKTIKIDGAGCKLGIDYGLKECNDPRRIVTTSIKLPQGATHKMLSVKTSSDIPKDKIEDVVKVIKAHEPKSSYKVGDIVIEDIMGLGVNIVATRNISL